jgi:hypothetical protein
MKNLNLFLWIFTTAMATYFAYHTYTHTRIRYKDLESVMMQNLAQEKGIEITRNNTERQFTLIFYLIEKQGNTPADLRIANKVKAIYLATDNTLRLLDSINSEDRTLAIDDKFSISNETLNFMSEYGYKIPKQISLKDTSLLELAIPIIPFIDNKRHFYPFSQQATLAYKNRFARLETKGVDRILSRTSGPTIKFDKIFAMASQKKYVFSRGEMYEAKVFLGTSDLETAKYYFACQMQVSEGKIYVKRDVGDIEIKNVKAPKYNSEGKATKTLTGKITIKKADGNDTTFMLSTSYTVKKKL